MTTQHSFVRLILISLFCFSAFWQSAAYSAEPVNINTATAAQIAETLKGIGIKRAEAIVAYRDKNGKFTTIEALLEVKGVGEKTLEANKGAIIF